ncbi:MAG: hypothetical protein JWN82_415 [Candidatus Saccharibacteria bacterium]|nr:hypothetical protein [Candidatus Saccharibacteria bacterium]
MKYQDFVSIRKVTPATTHRIRDRRYKKFTKHLIVSVLVATFVLSLAKPDAVHAASTPSLGAAATYGLLANTYTNSAAGTTVNGDVGFLVAPTMEPAPIGGHTNYGTGGVYATAGANQATALTGLGNEGCTFSWIGAVDLFLDSAHGTAGTYAPGVYCSPGAFTQTGSITLSGSGTYIFRSVGAYTTTAGVSILLAGGASACDVFWTPHATTFGAGTNFVGTLFDNDAVTSGAGTNIFGRILAFNGPVTTATTTINLPTCTPPPATLHVVKQVINDSGGSATAASFNMHIKLSGTDVAGSPAAGAASPGTPYTLAAGSYAVSEDANTAYSRTFSGDCDASGNITLASSDDKTCTITNDDRPASITVTKTVINDSGGTKVVADFPLFVGATSVTSGAANNFNAPASYTVSETTDPGYAQVFSGDCGVSGNVSVSPGDAKTCTITNNDISPTLHIIKTVINASGGTATASSFNMRVKLSGADVAGSPAAGAASPGTLYTLNAGTYAVSEDPNAAYTSSIGGDCSASGSVTLVAGDNKTCTITNTDIPPIIISAVPPLIDVEKVASPSSLPAGPGLVTYTFTLQNIGTAPVANITMVDDSCSPVILVSGDTNSDTELGTSETWVYTCSATLLATHTNNVIATGWANGLSTTDLASATVVVTTVLPIVSAPIPAVQTVTPAPPPAATSVPKFPSTGVAPSDIGGVIWCFTAQKSQVCIYPKLH